MPGRRLHRRRRSCTRGLCSCSYSRPPLEGQGHHGSNADGVVLNHVAVPAGAALGNSPLGRKVNPHQPEARAVAALPFEVVKYAPYEVAMHVGTGLDRLMQGLQVRLKIANAIPVIDEALAIRHVRGGTS